MVSWTKIRPGRVRLLVRDINGNHPVALPLLSALDTAFWLVNPHRCHTYNV